MIPILYERDETIFASNGLGRLRDMISATVTEERNGVYELDFDYPVTGQNFDKIKLGRIVLTEHDDSGDLQPFDIMSYSRAINGVVSFHCVHISYRQSYMTVTGENINSLTAAFDTLKNESKPNRHNPFIYWSDKTSTGYIGAFDGVPKTVRSMLGGTEGSILDTYGGEYEWDRFTVRLWKQRGKDRDFTIRYGLNMTEFTDETDTSECFTSIVPYWTDGTTTVVGAQHESGESVPSGRLQVVPYDLSEKFESEPTRAELNQMASDVVTSLHPALPTQNITVSFVRLQDSEEYSEYGNLMRCGLCDTVKVIFPDYETSARFKIVRTVWDVLNGRYSEMELGDLSTSLSEALGISDVQRDGKSTIEQIIDRLDNLPKTVSGRETFSTITTGNYADKTISFGADTFTAAPNVVACLSTTGTAANIGNVSVSVHTITATGATLRVFNNRGGDLAPAVEWVAVGV